MKNLKKHNTQKELLKNNNEIQNPAKKKINGDGIGSGPKPDSASPQ